MYGAANRALFAAAVCAGLVACDSSPVPAGPTGVAHSASVTSLTVTGTRPTVGTSSQFSVQATFTDGTTRDVTSEAAWDSSAPDVASASTSGLVQGVRLGYAEIAASFRGVTKRQGMFVTTDSGNYFVFKSDPGDPLGDGSSFAVSKIRGTTFSTEVIVVDRESQPVVLTVALFAGNRLIGPGSYDGASIWPSGSATLPRINFLLRSRPCPDSSQGRGRFEISELESQRQGGDTERLITRLRATFELFCGGSGPGSRGEIVIRP